MHGTWNLARAVVATASARPGLRIGTVDDQLDLEDAVRLAAGRARSLLDDGLRPGRPVALVGPTSADYVVSWLACLLAGLPVALVNPTYPGDLIARMLAPLAPERVLGEDEVRLARRVGPSAPDALPGLDADALRPVSYMHTSGTTGLPKLCAQSHEYFRRLGTAMGEALGLTASDRVLAPLPLFHINPMGYGLITALLAGADVLGASRFSASGFWPAVRDERISVLILHAPPVEILKRATGPVDAAGHRVRTMFYADGDFMRRFGVPHAVSGYGSTEAGGVSHLVSWSAGSAVPPDAGRHGGPGRSDIEWRLGPDGEVLLRERAPGALFSGYVTPTGLDPARDAGGWFETGDIGRVAEDGSLVFVERRAESIRVKGEFVPIPFVEDRLAGLPGVADHAIWKRRGPLVDEEVVLYTVADALPLDELHARIAQLPPFMRPVAVARIEALPRDAAAGKVQRRLLGAANVLEWVEL
jgi:crotonobetaine/carnitine-CoA ligase